MAMFILIFKMKWVLLQRKMRVKIMTVRTAESVYRSVAPVLSIAVYASGVILEADVLHVSV